MLRIQGGILRDSWHPIGRFLSFVYRPCDAPAETMKSTQKLVESRAAFSLNPLPIALTDCAYRLPLPIVVQGDCFSNFAVHSIDNASNRPLYFYGSRSFRSRFALGMMLGGDSPAIPGVVNREYPSETPATSSKPMTSATADLLSLAMSSARPGGLEPPTSGFGDRRSTN